MKRYARIATRWCASARSYVRIVVARCCGAEIGKKCWLGSGVGLSLNGQFGQRGRLVIGDKCELMDGVILHPYGGEIAISPGVFIGPFTVIYGHGGVAVGENTLISMHCRILSSNHSIPAAEVLIRSQPDVEMPTRIGRDVWLGAGATILGGVTIGDGCVIGAGAVVTKDLPPNTIAVGVPAVSIGSRPRA